MRVDFGYSVCAILLVVLVGCSKQMILYNEEILVAVAFVGFVMVTEGYTRGSESVFSHTGASIHKACTEHLHAQEAYCMELMKHHELRRSGLCSSTQMIGDVCMHDMMTRCGAHCDQRVAQSLSAQLSGQLKTLVGVQDESRELFQSQIVSGFRNTVWNQFRFAKLRKHQSKLVRSALHSHVTPTHRTHAC